MNYSSLEDAYGTPFGQRVPITVSQASDPSPKTPPSATKDKNSMLAASITSSLPLDTNPATQSFNATPPPLPQAPLDPSIPVQRAMVRESFTMAGASAGGGDDSKLDRILRLVEQNKTGYEPAATQDMLLYIATGVFFLFTFDTFVTLGKSMRGR